MQISRKCKHYSDWCAAGVFADTWKSWGFMDAYTGGEIEPNTAYVGNPSTNVELSINDTDWKYKWKYDLNDNYNYFYFANRCYQGAFTTKLVRLYFNTSYSKNFNCIRENTVPNYSLSSSYPLRLAEYLNFVGTVSRSYCIYYSNYANMFFMPLKNNGFFYNREASNGIGDNTYATEHTMNGYPLKLTTRYKQLSPYLWDLYTYRRVCTDYGAATCTLSNCTVIGFFNNITNKMNYIILTIPEGYGRSGESANLNTIYTYWDHKDGAVSTSIPYMDSTGEYTDVKENICTLIKYPYDDGALSNLFLISTCPQRKKRSFMNEIANDACGLEGKFFSFNGRNFYGFYNNLAVELPSN